MSNIHTGIRLSAVPRIQPIGWGVIAGAAQPILLTAGTISGTPAVGQELSVTGEVWAGSPSLVYSWRRVILDGNGDPILDGSGNPIYELTELASTAAYTPVIGDAGEKLVRLTTADGLTVAYSSVSDFVYDELLGAPWLEDGTITGYTLPANTFWSETGGTLKVWRNPGSQAGRLYKAVSVIVGEPYILETNRVASANDSIRLDFNTTFTSGVMTAWEINSAGTGFIQRSYTPTFPTVYIGYQAFSTTEPNSGGIRELSFRRDYT